MPITTVLFDLDGTLLPMDQNVFVKGYLKMLADKMAPHGYEPRAVIDAVWAGVGAMVHNDGSASNEEVFWAAAVGLLGKGAIADRPIFDEFYAVDFQGARELCGYSSQAVEAVRSAKGRGLRVGCATNPLFPKTATYARIGWAGLSPEDFELVTTYENSGFCKPNPAYYADIAARLGVAPQECLMVGNDVAEDVAASTEAGMEAFLLTDCLINAHGAEIGRLPHGGFEELGAYLDELGGRPRAFWI